MIDSDAITTDKLHEGLDLTAQRLLEHKKIADGTFIVADEHGNVHAVPARDIQLH